MTDQPSAWYLVATDDGDDDAYTACREAGLDLAAGDRAGVILYDRSTESKVYNPYPAGPWSDEDDAASPSDELSPEELRELGRGYLADQVVDARDRGIPTRAHMAVDTGAEALEDAVRRYQPTKLVFPRRATDGGALLDRLTSGTVGDLLSDTHAEVVLVDTDGEVERR